MPMPKFLGMKVCQSCSNRFTNLAYPLVYWEERADQQALSNNFEYLFGYPYYQNKNELEEVAVRFKEPEKKKIKCLTHLS